VVDALGKPSSGILDGAVQWVGDYDECMRINSDTQAPFDGKYCKMSLPINMVRLFFLKFAWDTHASSAHNEFFFQK